MLSAGFGIHESPALNFLFRLSGQGQARVGPGHRWSEKYLSVLTTGLAYHWPTLARPNIGLTLGPGQRPTLVIEGRPGLLRTLLLVALSRLGNIHTIQTSSGYCLRYFKSSPS